MATSPRKRILMGLGLLLLAGLSVVFWPYLASPSKIEDFCGSLASGASFAQVQAQAAQQGYRVSSLADNRAFVHEPGSFGRFTCHLRFASDKLVSSAYSVSD
jgi:hypothetical protein